MAVVELTTAHQRATFFQEALLGNLEYWSEWLTGEYPPDIADLDEERNNIIKAVDMGFESGEMAWPATARLLMIFAPYMERLGQWEVWNERLQIGIQFASGIKDQTNFITLSSLLARLLYRQSRFQESIITYKNVIRAARRWKLPFEEARACTNLGFFFVERERWYLAEVLCCHALEVFHTIDNQHGIAHTHNHLGVLYTRQRRFDEAEQQLNQAQLTWRRKQDEHGLMLSAMNLGVLYNFSLQPEKALASGNEALTLAEHVGEAQEIGAIHMNLGVTYLLLGQLSKAEQANLTAKTILEPQRDTIGLAHIFENLGKIYLEMKRWEKAIEYLEPVLSQWQQLGNTIQEIQTTIYLSEYAFGVDDKNQANSWLNQAERLLHLQSQSATHLDLQSQIDEVRHKIDRDQC